MMKTYGVNHITSSPHYPQSNGLAEKFVQIVKNWFHKAKEEGKDTFKCLMIYHNTPFSSSLQSPMQIVQSRYARSDLPMANVARIQKCLEANTRMNIYLHMIYTWVKMLCSKTKQASSAFKLPLQACVQNQEVIR